VQRATLQLRHRADDVSAFVQRDQRGWLALTAQCGVQCGQVHAVVHRVGVQKSARGRLEVVDVVVD